MESVEQEVNGEPVPVNVEDIKKDLRLDFSALHKAKVDGSCDQHTYIYFRVPRLTKLTVQFDVWCHVF